MKEKSRIGTAGVVLLAGCLAVAAGCLALRPASAWGQPVGFAVGARVGTIGIGPEASVRFGPLGVRGGYGLLPLKLDATRFYDIDGVVKADLELPRSWYTIGADFHLGQFMRLGGGILYKPGDVVAEVALEPDATVRLGDQRYLGDVVSGFTGTHVSRSTAFFALVGFGANVPGGFGVSLDLGAAFLGDAEVGLSATGDPDVVNSAAFRANLEAEEDRIADEAATYLKYWPVLNVSVRFGFGG